MNYGQKLYIKWAVYVCLASKSFKLNMADFTISYEEDRIKLAQSQS